MYLKSNKSTLSAPKHPKLNEQQIAPLSLPNANINHEYHSLTFSRSPQQRNSSSSPFHHPSNFQQTPLPYRPSQQDPVFLHYLHESPGYTLAAVADADSTLAEEAPVSRSSGAGCRPHWQTLIPRSPRPSIWGIARQTGSVADLGSHRDSCLSVEDHGRLVDPTHRGWNWCCCERQRHSWRFC